MEYFLQRNVPLRHLLNAKPRLYLKTDRYLPSMIGPLINIYYIVPRAHKQRPQKLLETLLLVKKQGLIQHYKLLQHMYVPLKSVLTLGPEEIDMVFKD